MAGDAYVRPSTPPESLPAPTSALQGLAFEALDDAWRLVRSMFNDSEGGVAVACTQAIVLTVADLANELRANRDRIDTALRKSFGADGALEEELHPNGEGYGRAPNG